MCAQTSGGLLRVQTFASGDGGTPVKVPGGCGRCSRLQRRAAAHVGPQHYLNESMSAGLTAFGCILVGCAGRPERIFGARDEGRPALRARGKGLALPGRKGKEYQRIRCRERCSFVAARPHAPERAGPDPGLTGSIKLGWPAAQIACGRASLLRACLGGRRLGSTQTGS